MISLPAVVIIYVYISAILADFSNLQVWLPSTDQLGYIYYIFAGLIVSIVNFVRSGLRIFLFSLLAIPIGLFAVFVMEQVLIIIQVMLTIALQGP